ncbi:hypothetical protein ACWD5F_04930 [Streptomyces sp. NPDC002499]
MVGDWYDRRLRDENEANQEQRRHELAARQERLAAWIDGLTDDELHEMQPPREAVGAGRGVLRAELAACTRASGGSGS